MNLPELLSADEVQDLTSQIHAAQREAEAAAQERENDPAIQDLAFKVVVARKAVEKAQAELDEADHKYRERVVLAQELEALLRTNMLENWPVGEGKTIGHATLTTRVKLQRRNDTPPARVVAHLENLLGHQGAERVVVDVKLDDKLLLPAWDLHGEELSKVLDRVESHSLTIRKPKEA